MNRIVLPATTLLDSNAAPFRLGEEASPGQRLGQFLGENDVSDVECVSECVGIMDDDE